MVDLTHYLWACQHPCPWSSRPDHPLFLRVSFRSCLYLTSYADRRSDGSLHGYLNRLASRSSQAIPCVMEREWHRTGTGTADLFHCVQRCGGCLASKCAICVAVWSPHQPLALPPLGSLFPSSPRLFAQRLAGRVRHWLHPLAHLPTGEKLCGIPRCIWTCGRLP